MAAPIDCVQVLASEVVYIDIQEFTQEHLNVLQRLTEALREQVFRCCLGQEVLQKLWAILSELCHKLETGGVRDSGSLLLRLCAECCRSLRNACVNNALNQDHLRVLGCIRVALRLINTVLEAEQNDCVMEVLRCGLQFLGNISAGNQLCKEEVWEQSFPHMFLLLLEHQDEKIAAYAAMVLHTCLDLQKVKSLVEQEDHQHVARKVISVCRRQPELEWPALIVTQHFLKSSELIGKVFEMLSNLERVVLLELMVASLATCEEHLPVELAELVASSFVLQCRAVHRLTVHCPRAAEEAMTVVRLLEVLCEMTSDHQPFMFLQHYPELLTTTLDVLKEIHILGKANCNVFSNGQDFLCAPLISNPAMNFKALLVRLIGNLCHCNSTNQDKVRELDGIALLLDNCRMDSNNPFICQWAVFAIHILLEKNLENQEVIRSLEKKHAMDGLALRELGLRVEEHKGNMMLRPISKDS